MLNGAPPYDFTWAFVLDERPGGPDGRTPFVVVQDWRRADSRAADMMRLTTGPRTGQVLIAEAPAPRAGWP